MSPASATPETPGVSDSSVASVKGRPPNVTDAKRELLNRRGASPKSKSRSPFVFFAFFCSNPLCFLCYLLFNPFCSAGMGAFQDNVFFCASFMDQRGKELYAGCSKLSMSLAHCRSWANYMLLFVTRGTLWNVPGIPPDTDIDADDFVS